MSENTRKLEPAAETVFRNWLDRGAEFSAGEEIRVPVIVSLCLCDWTLIIRVAARNHCSVDDVISIAVNRQDHLDEWANEVADWADEQPVQKEGGAQ